MRVNYYEYMASPTWLALAKQAKERDGHKCRICNSELRLEVHHRSYKRLGKEGEVHDLITLCHKCHKTFEEALPTATELLPTILDEELWEMREQWLGELDWRDLSEAA